MSSGSSLGSNVPPSPSDQPDSTPERSPVVTDRCPAPGVVGSGASGAVTGGASFVSASHRAVTRRRAEGRGRGRPVRRASGAAQDVVHDTGASPPRRSSLRGSQQEAGPGRYSMPVADADLLHGGKLSARAPRGRFPYSSMNAGSALPVAVSPAGSPGGCDGLRKVHVAVDAVHQGLQHRCDDRAAARGAKASTGSPSCTTIVGAMLLAAASPARAGWLGPRGFGGCEGGVDRSLLRMNPGPAP